MTQIERYLTLIIRPETRAFEAFSKVEVLMFFGKRALRASLLILLAKLKTRLLSSVPRGRKKNGYTKTRLAGTIE
jgi:hypothetical protein